MLKCERKIAGRTSDKDDGEGEEESQPDTQLECTVQTCALSPMKDSRRETSTLVHMSCIHTVAFMADVSFQSSLQSLLKKSKGLKWTGPGSYDVIKRTTLTPSVPLDDLEEYDESLLCSQLWAMLDSPDCPPLLCQCKRAGDDVTQCLRPANDACVGKRPVTSSSMQPECGGDDAHVHKRV